MWGYAGLVTAFILLASVLLWLFIESPRTKTVFKIILVPILLWYGIALYYAVPNFMGWPTLESIPDDSQVLAIRIKEPDPKRNDPGAIYFWVNTKPGSKSPEQTLVARLNPKNVFSYSGETDPRVYKLPYSRETHKAILEAQRKAQGVPGAQLRTKKKKGKKGRPGGEDSKAKLVLEIVNPISSIPK